MSARLERSFQRMYDLCDRLEKRLELVDEFLFQVCAVSRWSIGEHLFHIALANASMFDVIEGLAQGKDYPDGRKGLSLLGTMMMWSGWIPRGRGKVPDSMRPPPEVDRETLARKLKETRETLNVLAGKTHDILEADGRASHRVFGGLKATQWLDYAYVHSMHHVKIVRDIERAVQAQSARP